MELEYMYHCTEWLQHSYNMIRGTSENTLFKKNGSALKIFGPTLYYVSLTAKYYHLNELFDAVLLLCTYMLFHLYLPIPYMLTHS